jgi:catechol 2,3-dioxygenase-like lactoylglutathione lyase family enzyme
MQIKGIHHIAIKVKPEQFDRVTGFYKKLLGLLEVRSWGSGNNRAVMISTGDNSVLEIMSNATDEVPSEGALRHIAFACDDPDGFAKLLEENGRLGS